ncbi:hypothetical protein [Kribbella flavida]|uniref:hypothetical protein n=1 Tax=Kribbella flavida TaxID=182640 RepID=UPI0011D18D1F|nr:hypothetical protein [Kribbella flavida]
MDRPDAITGMSWKSVPPKTVAVRADPHQLLRPELLHEVGRHRDGGGQGGGQLRAFEHLGQEVAELAGAAALDVLGDGREPAVTVQQGQLAELGQVPPDVSDAVLVLAAGGRGVHLAVGLQQVQRGVEVAPDVLVVGPHELDLRLAYEPHRGGKRLPNAQYCSSPVLRCQHFAGVRNRSPDRRSRSCRNCLAGLV